MLNSGTGIDNPLDTGPADPMGGARRSHSREKLLALSPVHSSLFGCPVLLDPRLQSDVVEFRSTDGTTLCTLTNVGRP